MIKRLTELACARLPALLPNMGILLLLAVGGVTGALARMEECRCGGTGATLLPVCGRKIKNTLLRLIYYKLNKKYKLKVKVTQLHKTTKIGLTVLFLLCLLHALTLRAVTTP